MPPGVSEDGMAWRRTAGIEIACSQLCVSLALLPLNDSAPVARSEADAMGIVDGSAIADFREARPVLTRRQILLAGAAGCATLAVLRYGTNTSAAVGAEQQFEVTHTDAEWRKLL